MQINTRQFPGQRLIWDYIGVKHRWSTASRLK